MWLPFDCRLVSTQRALAYISFCGNMVLLANNMKRAQRQISPFHHTVYIHLTLLYIIWTLIHKNKVVLVWFHQFRANCRASSSFMNRLITTSLRRLWRHADNFFLPLKYSRFHPCISWSNLGICGTVGVRRYHIYVCTDLGDRREGVLKMMNV